MPVELIEFLERLTHQVKFYLMRSERANKNGADAIALMYATVAKEIQTMIQSEMDKFVVKAQWN